MKKLVSVVLILAMVLSLTACGSKADNNEKASSLKVGLICLHDENSTYDLNFINAFTEACANYGISEENYIIKTNIPEDNGCYEAAAELVDEGCDIVFSDSFGHQSYMLQAAKEFTDVLFSSATGVNAHTADLDNYVNAFASIYEGRYLAGVAAGMKLNEMIEAGTITADQAKMGYVGAYTYAEVISGYTSFYLGAKSVCPSVTMEVTFTGSWYDETAEKEGAEMLIKNGCVLISQHADSLGAPTACENNNVPNVSYNGSTIKAGPNTFIVSSRINWAPYYEYVFKAVEAGEKVDVDWTGTLATGSVELTDVNADVAAEGTEDAMKTALDGLKDGSVHVFDTANFTVGGETLTTYLADVDDMGDFVPETEAIADGYFHESEYRSAPYFDIQIDGITLLNTQF
ncbi:MAG: BMP family ABC transporter substrate-binding protein [Lachnospiraceae bacterium]|nr:BMP family ABC transporter substrate-binding protein [Lachnospiraceae bacterium]